MSSAVVTTSTTSGDRITTVIQTTRSTKESTINPVTQGLTPSATAFPPTSELSSVVTTPTTSSDHTTTMIFTTKPIPGTPGTSGTPGTPGATSFSTSSEMSSSAVTTVKSSAGDHTTTMISTTRPTPGNFMVFVAKRWAILLAYPHQGQSVLDATFEELHLSDVERPVSVQFDPADEKLYWIDGYHKAIFRAFLNGSNHEHIANASMGRCELVLDFESRRMYWTLYYGRRIRRSHFNGSGAEDLITDRSSPRGLAIDRENRYLFWKEKINIMRSNLDGENMMLLAISESQIPTCIAWHSGVSRLFWIDEEQQKVESAASDGSDRTEVFQQTFSKPFKHIEVHGTDMYLTSHQLEHMGHVSLLDPTVIRVVNQLQGKDSMFILNYVTHVYIHPTP